MSRTHHLLLHLLLTLPFFVGACAPDAVSCVRATDDVCDGLCVDLTTSTEHCGACGNACDTFCDDGSCVEITCRDALDLLFVVDDSNSMTEEQTFLAVELPRFLRGLLGDGSSPPLFTSVRLGIVSTDMGASDTVSTCGNPPGDDGILRSPATAPGCGASASRFFEFAAAPMPSPAELEAAACVTRLGTSGCGFEQQLEAGLKAISPSVTAPWVASSYVPPSFVLGSGHGGPGDENAGFVRAESILGIFFFSDEEDCSTPTPETLFGPGDSVALNLRCFSRPEQLHPVRRFVDGLAALRSSTSDLVVGATVGIPPDAEGMSYDAILAHPAMQETLDTSSSPPSRLLPSCTTSRGVAFPPRRFIAMLAGLEARGASTSVSSICDDGGYLDDFAGAIAAAAHPELCGRR